MSKKNIRVLLIDPFLSSGEALSFRLRDELFIDSVNHVATIDEAVQQCDIFFPHVIVTDKSLPDGGAFKLSQTLRERSMNSKIAIISNEFPDIFLSQALQQDFRGFLLRKDNVQTIASAILNISQGGIVFSNPIRNRVQFVESKENYALKTKSKLMMLSERQIEVMVNLANGLTVKEVAVKMHLSTKSIDSHKYRIMSKLDIHDRVELARFAIREGLIEP